MPCLLHSRGQARSCAARSGPGCAWHAVLLAVQHCFSLLRSSHLMSRRAAGKEAPPRAAGRLRSPALAPLLGSEASPCTFRLQALRRPSSPQGNRGFGQLSATAPTVRPGDGGAQLVQRVREEADGAGAGGAVVAELGAVPAVSPQHLSVPHQYHCSTTSVPPQYQLSTTSWWVRAPCSGGAWWAAAPRTAWGLRQAHAPARSASWPRQCVEPCRLPASSCRRTQPEPQAGPKRAPKLASGQPAG